MSNRTIVSSGGNAIKEAVFRKFDASLLGQIIAPEDDNYNSIRVSWTGVTDPRGPALIARCVATSNVVRAIDFARTDELKIEVRAGGHSFNVGSFCDGGMVIDLPS